MAPMLNGDALVSATSEGTVGALNSEWYVCAVYAP